VASYIPIDEWRQNMFRQQDDMYEQIREPAILATFEAAIEGLMSREGGGYRECGGVLAACSPRLAVFKVSELRCMMEA
jgi:hypothetical protein